MVLIGLTCKLATHPLFCRVIYCDPTGILCVDLARERYDTMSMISILRWIHMTFCIFFLVAPPLKSGGPTAKLSNVGGASKASMINNNGLG